MFTGIKKKPQSTTQAGEQPKTSHGFPWRKIFWISLLTLVVLLVLGYFLLKLVGIGSKVSQSWQEMKFAYDKPVLVQSIRSDYEKRQKDLEQSFLKKQQTAQDKLLEEVANKLKSDSLK